MGLSLQAENDSRWDFPCRQKMTQDGTFLAGRKWLKMGLSLQAENDSRWDFPCRQKMTQDGIFLAGRK
jgi:hypothetical protein